MLTFETINELTLQQKMQKVPINFITAMQSKRLQNYNRYQLIYSVDKILLSPINA